MKNFNKKIKTMLAVGVLILGGTSVTAQDCGTIAGDCGVGLNAFKNNGIPTFAIRVAGEPADKTLSTVVVDQNGTKFYRDVIVNANFSVGNGHTTNLGTTIFNEVVTASGELSANGGIKSTSVTASGIITANGGINSTSITASAGLGVTGTAGFNNDINVVGDLNLLSTTSDLDVNGNTVLNTLTVDGKSTLTGNTTVGGTLTANGGIKLPNTDDNLSVGGTSTLTGILTANGTITANGGIQVGDGTLGTDKIGDKIQFATSTNNSDDLFIARVNRASDKSNILVNIGNENSATTADTFTVGNGTTSSIAGSLNNKPYFTVNSAGYVGIGTVGDINYELSVNGGIKATNYTVTTAMAADYVFENDYKLISLKDTEAYIKENKHLPAFKSAKHYEANGYTMVEMNVALEQTVEELTLHAIAQEKKIAQLETEMAAIKALLLKK
jgi:hypothetical protein